MWKKIIIKYELKAKKSSTSNKLKIKSIFLPIFIILVIKPKENIIIIINNNTNKLRYFSFILLYFNSYNS